MRKAKREILTELDAPPPTADATEALGRNLLYAMYRGLTPEDMTAIVAKEVEKAKNGDGKSARFLIGMVQAGSRPAPATHMQQAVIVNQQQEKSLRFLSDARRQLVCMIAEVGPLKTEEVAKRMHLLQNDAALALDHDWFEREADGWHVTGKGRAEVLGAKELEA